ncbi:hypothetical protein FIBSPDRAFT_953120 [Athelia psychrophila]|uniref:Uncharacterized protein n=1 Tax=Athelia psychrophila TaxID=1759441 RepID=A0A166KLF7_9AGAM|nr:hypothetical protein FIBSPDRAFT_953120 [Fibularhizoctonia sp. CBS 109695]
MCEGLQSLHTHLSSLELSDVSGSNRLPLDLKRSNEDLLLPPVNEIKNAVPRSLQGTELIQYDDLPQKWRSNKYNNRGCRFIPLERWPLIVRSMLSLHNEFRKFHPLSLNPRAIAISTNHRSPCHNLVNVHMHLIPPIAWSAALLTLPSDPVETAYI